jgi:hypothetical protein
MEGITGVVIVAALVSLGLIQALVKMVKTAGVRGIWLNLAAIVIGVALAVMAKVVFPEVLTAFSLAQVAVFGGLSGFSATGLWQFRNGEPTPPEPPVDTVEGGDA